MQLSTLLYSLLEYSSLVQWGAIGQAKMIGIHQEPKFNHSPIRNILHLVAIAKSTG